MLKRHTVILSSLILMALSVQGIPSWADPLAANRLYNQGIEHYNKGNTQMAIDMFERAVTEDPDMTDAYYNLGSLYTKQKSYDKARLAFYRVTQLSPTDSQAKYQLALTLEKMNKLDPAIAYFEQVTADSQYYKTSQGKANDLKAKRQAQLKTQAKQQARNNEGWDPIWQPSKPLKTTTNPDPWRPNKTTETVLKNTTAKLAVETMAQGFSGPTGIALGADGRLFVANYTQNTIFRVSPNGDKQVFYDGKGLHGPLGLTVDQRNGMVYVANYLENNIVRITPGGQLSVLASGLKKPYYLSLDPAHNMLYVSEQETNSVSRIDLAP